MGFARDRVELAEQIISSAAKLQVARHRGFAKKFESLE